jgi:hypothetical protein
VMSVPTCSALQNLFAAVGLWPTQGYGKAFGALFLRADRRVPRALDENSELIPGDFVPSMRSGSSGLTEDGSQLPFAQRWA